MQINGSQVSLNIKQMKNYISAPLPASGFEAVQHDVFAQAFFGHALKLHYDHGTPSQALSACLH